MSYSVTCLFLLTGISLFAQNQSSNTGKTFWVGFMENASTPLALNLHFASRYPSNINISVPVLGNVSFSLRAGRDTLVSIPTALAHITGSESVQSKGVYISSDTAISVLAMNNAPFSTDAISLVPLEFLPKGGRYCINTFRGSNSFSSEFLVLAPEDNTLVEITPAHNTRLGKAAGVPFTIMLQRGETYQVQSKDSNSMGGSLVRVGNGCKKLVVFSGSQCSQVNYNVGCSGCDHLWEQELPTSFWGTDFYSVPLTGMSGYMLSIVAKENGTTVSIDGVPTYTLSAGQQVTPDFSNNNVRCIQADKPISVVQLIKSGECNGHPQHLADPAMFRLVPEGQEVKSTFFRVPLTTNITYAFLSVICVNPADVLLDGVSINSISGNTVAGTCAGKQVVTVPVLAQYHTLESNDPFCAYLYGYGNAESYALAMGSAYENLELNFTLNPADFMYCNTPQKFDFTAINKGYSNLKWDFENGNTANGNTASFTFTKSRRYEVKLMGSKPDSDCPEDTVSKFITLFSPPELDLGNDTIICKQPDYLVVPTTNPNYDFEWHTGSHAKNYLCSQNELVTLTVTDEHGCQATDSVEITFSECLKKKLEFPNVFTPGKDGVNDEFKITLEVFNNAQCIIYNRWGVELYKYNPQVDKPWNGGVSNDPNQPCPDGTYYFLLYYSDPIDGNNLRESGVITLIREK